MLTRDSIRYSWRRYILSFLWLYGAALAGAQNIPEMREVLARLDRLENDNRALTEEIRALRKELAGLHGPEAAAETAASAQPSPDGQARSDGQASGGQQTDEERQAVQDSRIEELAQTKVESSQKFPIRITGMVLFNAFTNGRYNNQADNPAIASLAPGNATGGGTLAQSTLGLLFNGPVTIGGAKVSGSLYMDFFGGSTASLDHLVRLRTASINLDWTNTTLSFGQEKPIISPRDPDSLAQVGVSPLTGAGNLWLWQPQIRLEQRVSLDSQSGLLAQVGVFQTSLLNAATADSYASPQPGEPTEGSSPGGEGRLEFWRRWSETGRLEIAGGFHVNRNHVGRFSLPSNVYSLDWFFRPFSKVEFSGMFFHGRNVAVLGGLQQGFTVLHGRWIAVPSTGGWAQLRFPITPRLAFDIYGGQQADRNSDLPFGYMAKNQGYFGNVMYRLAPNVVVSLEGGQIRTTYFQIGNRLNDHYDLAIAYMF
jgi:hypothetical protein